MAAEWGPTIQGSTRGMPGWSGHDLFCDAIAEVYVGVLPRRPERPSFDADFATYDLSDASLGMIDTPAVWADRTRSSIRHVPDDALFINHSTTPWGLQQGGREWAAGAASALVLDNAQPFTVTVGENRRLRLSSLRVPQSLVGRRLAEPEALNDALSRGGVGALLGTQMGMLAAATRARLAGAATAMVDTVLELLDAASRGVAPPDRVATMKAYVESRLADPRLGAAEVARAFGCSVRTVHEQFGRDGTTLGSYLRAARLDRARQMLLAPAPRTRTIAAIARECGFADVGTFHRAYRARFGVSPAADR